MDLVQDILEQVGFVCKDPSLLLVRARTTQALALALYDLTRDVHGLTKTWRPIVEIVSQLNAFIREEADEWKRHRREASRKTKALHPEFKPCQTRVLRMTLEQLERLALKRKGSTKRQSQNQSTEREIASRIVSIVLIASEAATRGIEDVRLLCVEDDLQRLSLVFGGIDFTRANLDAFKRVSRLWNSTMLRPIESFRAASGPRDVHGALVPKMETVHAAKVILRRLFDQFLSRCYGWNFRQDAEFVHEMRVTLRRLRSALRMLGKILGEPGRELAQTVREFGKALGAIRDVDVFMSFLEGHAENAPPTQLPGLRRLMASQKRRRSRNYRRLAELMESDGLLQLRQRFAALMFEGTAEVTREARRPLRRQAPEILRKRLKKILKFNKPLESYSDKQQHALRIQCKRLRYTGEFFADLYPDALTSLVSAMTDMQDLLGVVHDMSVYAELLGGFRSRLGASCEDDAAEDLLEAFSGKTIIRRQKALSEACKKWRAFRKKKNLKRIKRIVKNR